MSLLRLSADHAASLLELGSQFALINSSESNLKNLEANTSIHEDLLTNFGPGTSFGKDSIQSIFRSKKEIADVLLRSILAQYPGDCALFKIASSVADYLITVMSEATVYIICNELCLFKARALEEANHISNMAAMLGAEMTQFRRNYLAGVNAGIVFTDRNGTQYYVKHFSDDVAQKIDPNEALVYKILQFMHLGPVTKFLIKLYSSGHGTAVKENYIMTQDVCAAETGLHHEFFLDDALHYSVYMDALENSRAANVELSVLSAVNDMALLGDTFANNPKNYGILRTTTDSGEVSYAFKMVDHLPRSNNTTFPPYRFVVNGEPYSPRASIQKRLDSKHHDARNCLVSLVGCADPRRSPLEAGRTAFPQQCIQEEVLARLQELPPALHRAREEIHELINQHERSFMPDARARLDSYADVILSNYNKYA